MLTLSLASALFLACTEPAKDDTASSTDTADTHDTSADTDTGGQDDGYVVSGESTAAAALVGSQLPASIFVVTLFASSQATDCPVVTEVSSTTTTIDGGCTDENGTTFSGTVTIVQASEDRGTIDFDAWIVEDVSGTRASADGLVDIEINGEQMGLGGTFLGATYRDASYGVPTEVSFTYTSWTQPLDPDFPLAAGISTGAMTIDGTPVSMSGDWDYVMECTARPTGGALVVTGGNVATFDFETACDACVPWTADDGASGEWCPA